MMVKLQGNPVDICNMPTTENSEVFEIYENMEHLLDTETKGKDYTIMGWVISMPK